MISRLKGIIIEKQPPFLVVDTNGVGYEVQVSMNTFYKLPEIGENIILFTHFVVREDAHLLFGFSDQNERSLFRTLIKVNGVGPKIALAILSSIEPNDFVKCVEQNDATALQKLPGIGKKTADRLIIEMRDKFKEWSSEGSVIDKLFTTTESKNFSSNLAEQDAISALISLGYKPQEASRAISKVIEPGISSQDLIRLALKNTV